MKEKVLSTLQKMGRSFMIPIAVLPIAGLFLGVGTAMTTDTMIVSLHLEEWLQAGTILNRFFVLLTQVGSTVFDNLPIIFAVSVASCIAKKSKEIAILSVVVAFFVMHSAINALLTLDGTIVNGQVVNSHVLEGTITSVCGILSFEMGVFGGIIVGLGVGFLHNRFYQIQLPTCLSFFEGERFVPIISVILFSIFGIIIYFVWPPIQNGIFYLGNLMASSGYAGTFGFGVIKRALIPFGLHHVFYLPFWQTAVGGSMVVNGEMVHGAQNIFFAQLSDPTLLHFSVDATKYFSGEFLFMMFGLPGAALAMYHCTPSKNKKRIASLLISASLTSMLTGITEPVEFMFLFSAPMLFAVHVFLAGRAYVITQLCNIAIGLTFSAGLIDYIVFGVLQGDSKTGWIMVVPLGILYFLLYYIIFRTLIRKFDLKTFGSQNENLMVFKDVEMKDKFTPDKFDRQSQLIVQGLGGRDNFDEFDCCITRIRTQIINTAEVNEGLLKQSGAAAVVVTGNSVQIIFGPKASTIKTNLDNYLSNVPIEYDYYEQDADVEETEQTKKVTLQMMVEGECLPIEQAHDEIFSQKLLGDGIMIKPDNGLISAPCDAFVTMVYPSKHAIGLRLDNGCELLIHFGIDTVRLNGEGFELLVKSKQRIKCNDLLWQADLNYIKTHAISENLLIVVTSKDEYSLKKTYGRLERKLAMLEIDKGS